MAQRRAAVLGSPVSHSLSPVLHRAAYLALDLPHWRFDAIECDDVALPSFVAGLGLEWAGLSVIVPAKRAALDLVDSVTPTALAVGAANTLVYGPDRGWLADCTDVDGVVGSLAAYGVTAARSAVVLGAGAMAAAAIVGLSRLGVSSLTVAARSALRATAVSDGGGRLATGLDVLLHQAFRQVQLFTRHPAPRAAMRSALWAAVGPDCPPLPLSAS